MAHSRLVQVCHQLRLPQPRLHQLASPPLGARGYLSLAEMNPTLRYSSLHDRPRHLRLHCNSCIHDNWSSLSLFSAPTSPLLRSSIHWKKYNSLQEGCSTYGRARCTFSYQKYTTSSKEIFSMTGHRAPDYSIF